jgi:hypothetical protein
VKRYASLVAVAALFAARVAASQPAPSQPPELPPVAPPAPPAAAEAPPSGSPIAQELPPNRSFGAPEPPPGGSPVAPEPPPGGSPVAPEPPPGGSPVAPEPPPGGSPVAEDAPPRADGAAAGRFSLEAGARITVIGHRGLDPYSDGDALPQLALGAGITPLRAAPFSLAIEADYALGASTGDARGAEASLTTHRLTLGIVGRAELGERLRFFARVAPGVVNASATITDPGFHRALDASAWAFGLDAVGGADLLVTRPDADVGLRLSVDLGYAYAGASEMSFTPESEDDDLRRFGPTRLPDLAVRGVTYRWAMSITF